MTRSRNQQLDHGHDERDGLFRQPSNDYPTVSSSSSSSVRLLERLPEIVLSLRRRHQQGFRKMPEAESLKGSECHEKEKIVGPKPANILHARTDMSMIQSKGA